MLFFFDYHSYTFKLQTCHESVSPTYDHNSGNPGLSGADKLGCYHLLQTLPLKYQINVGIRYEIFQLGPASEPTNRFTMANLAIFAVLLFYLISVFFNQCGGQLVRPNTLPSLRSRWILLRKVRPIFAPAFWHIQPHKTPYKTPHQTASTNQAHHPW
jgi:hypothetical protein